MISIERGGSRLRQRVGAGVIGGIGRGLAPIGQLVGRRTFGRQGVGFGALEQRVALQLLLDEGGDLLVGELQQLDRLPQLRRHDQRLALAELETRADGHRRRPFPYRLNRSPR